MEHLYIRKVFSRLIASTFLYCIVISCASQKVKHSVEETSYNIAGRYQKIKGNEILVLNADSTFICLRNYTSKSDVVVPLCDTLAKGFWKQQYGFISLGNIHAFNWIDYSVEEGEIQSKDSIYFKIVLPEEDALDYKNFKFSIIPSPLRGKFIESNKSEFATSKKLWGNINFSFVVQNLSPNTEYGKKPYQRIYFNVFEDYSPKNNQSNTFKITLMTFTQCFYEAMDINGEVIGITSDGLYWRGNAYRKIN